MSLIQAKGITDTLFAHWLQMLSGRQILVILDSGYAFSFAAAVEGRSGGIQFSHQRREPAR